MHCDHSLPEDADDLFFLCKELISGYLDGITGLYQTPQGYYVRDCDADSSHRGLTARKGRDLSEVGSKVAVSRHVHVNEETGWQV